MFVGSQTFPGSWGGNFVGSNFYFVNKYLTNACIHVRGDLNSYARVTHECHEHWSPTNNDDSAE